jgi:hypothetical protein
MILPPTKTYTEQTSQLSVRDFNTFGQVVRIINNISGPDVFLDATGLHFRKPIALTETLIARLTGSPSDGVYDWTQVGPKSDGTFENLTGGRDSDNSGTALPTNAEQSFSTGETTGDVVVLRRAVELDTGKTVWVIIGSAALPAGQYDGMVAQTTAQLTLGMGYLRIVNAPPT